MIIPDLNLVVFAHNSSSPFHTNAKEWWESVVNGDETVAIPWVVTLGFIRLTTHPRVFDPPAEVDQVLEVVRGWFAYPSVQPIEPGGDHLRQFSGLLSSVQVGAKLVNDAHLAAIAIEHRAVLHTHDRDFDRFSGLRLHDPLLN